MILLSFLCFRLLTCKLHQSMKVALFCSKIYVLCTQNSACYMVGSANTLQNEQVKKFPKEASPKNSLTPEKGPMPCFSSYGLLLGKIVQKIVFYENVNINAKEKFVYITDKFFRSKLSTNGKYDIEIK